MPKKTLSTRPGSVYARKWYARNPTAKAKKMQWAKANPDRVRATIARCRYGIEKAEWKALMAAPCCICHGKTTCVDHDHKTGKVRGGLCKNCNRGLGAFLDDPRLLRNAIAYLMKG